jgi:hypothetical protein
MIFDKFGVELAAARFAICGAHFVSRGGAGHEYA